jgi:EAL domain-containing protein (putative c-di-GMP-specific phosphodiesterase class I)/FixJ family two-component response regulator/HPt (histidine-containing phosphotransfer) domain-containing protein
MKTKRENENIHSIRKIYLSRLNETYHRLIHFQKSNPLSADELDHLEMIAHKLAGNGSTFGFPLLSQAAHQFLLRLELARKDNAFDSLHSGIIELSSSIQRELANSTGNPTATFSRVINDIEAPQKVFLLEDDLELAAYISAELRLEGYHLSVFSCVADINNAVQKSLPAVIIADIALPEGTDAGITWVNSIKACHKPPVPVIFASQKGDMQTRLNAVRAGADFYIKKPISINQLKAALYECAYKKPYEPYRIMLIDDDKLLASVLQLDLVNHGTNVKIVNDPAEAINEIEKFKPELILLDLYMPFCSGIELGQVIRQWLEYAAIPIIFMSTEQDINKQREAIRLAGDDLIVKPIETWQLSVNVITRVKRARMINLYRDQLAKELNHQQQYDLLTGLPNKRNLETALDDAIERAKSIDNQHLTALVWLDLDNFSNPDFVKHLIEVLQRHDIQPQHIELELTERTLALQEGNVVQSLNQLSELGASIAIDDFGTGYSSLSYLKKMPINLLKIDHAFIDGIPTDSDDCAITETIIRLANNLDVKVLAEGVETQEQATFLRELGCDSVQGFLYSLPLNSDDYGCVLANEHKTKSESDMLL